MYEESPRKAYPVSVLKMELVKEHPDRGATAKLSFNLAAGQIVNLHPTTVGSGLKKGSYTIEARKLRLMSTIKMAVPETTKELSRPQHEDCSQAETDLGCTLKCDSTGTTGCGRAGCTGPDAVTNRCVTKCNYYRHSAFIGGSTRCARLKVHCTYSRLRRLRLSLTNNTECPKEQHLHPNEGQSRPTGELEYSQELVVRNCHAVEMNKTQQFNIRTSDVERTVTLLQSGITKHLNSVQQPDIPPNDIVRNYLLDRIVENARFKRREAENCKF